MRLEWDKIGERFYETGVDKGVLYPFSEANKYATGVAWNGLSAVNENSSGESHLHYMLTTESM